ncbi:MAG: hypothetical protein IPM69_00510 [Ignavibacteria bacterium]|nr:hypothetical protein [Ignavibacteria bacterium]
MIAKFLNRPINYVRENVLQGYTTLRNTKKISLSILAIFLILLSIQACQSYKAYYFRDIYLDANTLLHDSRDLETKFFLKAHLKNGDVCILRDTWQIDTLKHIVTGSGTRYDFNRYKITEGLMSIPIDSVSVFETNKKIEISPETGRIVALTLMAAVEITLGIICISTPKACFGSCPTFYMNADDNYQYADAEGFSNAISPSMEYGDIDALHNPPLKDNLFTITMKNEALETHCVREVKLLAYPRKKGERIFHTPQDEFFRCSSTFSISKATASEGDITELLHTIDAKERYSLSDASNLSSKEEVFLNFDNVTIGKELGLVLNFRQTLMTTYLFYSGMGYMGDNVGDIYAMLEANKQTRSEFGGTTKELGDVEVYAWNEQYKSWEHQGSIGEIGPIAINKQILRLKNTSQSTSVRLKLVVNRGLWRFDYAALTTIEEKIKPISLQPVSVFNKGKVDTKALADLRSSEKYLISMPGSEYRLNFLLPEKNTDYELFLYSKGYYLEWMRKQWIKDKNLAKLSQMQTEPKKYLMEEAKEYKLYESTMEKQFWDSKINTKVFTYHEN